MRSVTLAGLGVAAAGLTLALWEASWDRIENQPGRSAALGDLMALASLAVVAAGALYLWNLLAEGQPERWAGHLHSPWAMVATLVAALGAEAALIWSLIRGHAPPALVHGCAGLLGLAVAVWAAPPAPPAPTALPPPARWVAALLTGEAPARTLSWSHPGPLPAPGRPPQRIDLQVRIPPRSEPGSVAEGAAAALAGPGPLASPAVGDLAWQIRSLAEQQQLTRLEEIRLVLGAAAAGPRGPAPAGGQPLPPDQTLAAEASDPASCTLLAAALLLALGYRPALLQGPRLAIGIPLPQARGLALRLGQDPALFAVITEDGFLLGNPPPGWQVGEWLPLEPRAHDNMT